MDERRFDTLTRLFATVASRRRGAGILLAALAAPLSPAPDSGARRRNAEARKRKRKRKKRGAGAPAGQCCNRQGCAPGPGKNLGRCCFEDRDFTARNFKGANLGGANFARATLTAADFAGANLDRACFVDANTTGTRFSNANRGTAIFCRTETSSGVDNSGCGRGTPCCPTCDAAHPCGRGEVCCEGRCIPGDCCDTGERSSCGAGAFCCDHRCVDGDCCDTTDCPTEVCQDRACRDHQCVYTPVFGEPGPGCEDPRVCCRDEQGSPACCDSGVRICQTSGVCGCAGNQDCGAGRICVAGTCVDGQGTCAAGADFCRQPGFPGTSCNGGNCRCRITTEGDTRCGGPALAGGSPATCGECAETADCSAKYLDVPGAFCMRGGTGCCDGTAPRGICMAPCSF
jgi:hypothetical protein